MPYSTNKWCSIDSTQGYSHTGTLIDGDALDERYKFRIREKYILFCGFYSNNWKKLQLFCFWYEEKGHCKYYQLSVIEYRTFFSK
jgi:hypothetical protein